MMRFAVPVMVFMYGTICSGRSPTAFSTSNMNPHGKKRCDVVEGSGLKPPPSPSRGSEVQLLLAIDECGIETQTIYYMMLC